MVLDRSSGCGFRLTMSGVGDNYQLHTLLAGRVIGPGLLDGDPPEPAWLDAATDGPPQRPETDPIARRFRLFDGHGRHVRPEGRPADIEPLDGTRVLVLHPPLGRSGWTAGRAYQHMPPSLTLDHPLPPTEAATWLSRTNPRPGSRPHGREPLLAINVKDFRRVSDENPSR